MKNLPDVNFRKEWGLVSRLMGAVSIAIVVAGAVQTYLLVVESAAEVFLRHEREAMETVEFLAPLIADQAVLGDYASIEQLLRKQVRKTEIYRLVWTDPLGKSVSAADPEDVQIAAGWFRAIAPIKHSEFSGPVNSGGAAYGTLYVEMTTVPAYNRLWENFIKQLQIVFIRKSVV